MALTDITIDFDLAQLLGSDFDSRRTKAYVTTNVESGTLMDTTTGETRLGDEAVTIGSDGTGSFTTWATGADGNPISWQTSLVVDYPRTGHRDRKTRTFGPWTLTTADAGKNITELEEEQAVPAEHLTSVTTLLDGYVTDAETAETNAEAAQAAAEAARDDAIDISGISTSDGVVEALVKNTGGAGPLTSAALAAGYEAGSTQVIHVNPTTGNNALFTGKLASAPKATIAAALTAIGAGNRGTILLSDGTHLVGNGLSLSGHRVSIVGSGAGHGASPSGCVIKADTQTGPVLDFVGYLWPDSARGRIEFGGFNVEGSGAADATKVRTGIRVADPAIAAAGCAWFHDITISNTGGPALDLGPTYLSDFDRITLCTPVSAKANDVPYLQALGANGNRFNGLGLRSILASADMGASGAIVFAPGAGYAPHHNEIIAPWIEYLHIPTNGAIFSMAGNLNRIVGAQFFDVGKESGATNTAYARFLPATPQDGGGNEWLGLVPGRAPGGGTAVDVGIDIQQTRNAVIGIKGYRGYNVQIASGIGNISVELTGAESGSTDPAVVDNSGLQTNHIVDRYLGFEQRGNTRWERDTSTGDLRLSRTTLGAAGLQFGAGAGPRMYTDTSLTPTTMNMRADAWSFLALNGTAIATFTKAFGPGLSVTAPSGQNGIQTSGTIKITSGGVQRVLATKTGGYTMNYSTDDIIVANGTTITITLPRADFAEAGRQYTVKNINATNCTVATSASNTIDGAATDTLAQWAVGRYISDGTNWIKG